MKIGQILEAKLANEKPLKDEAAKLPKLNRKGDFVWFLYKFFTVDKREPGMTINANFAEEALPPITEIIDHYKRQFPKSKIWPKVNSKKVAASMIEKIKPKSMPSRYDPEPYEEDEWEGAGGRAEYQSWLNDMEQEYQEEMEDYEREPYSFGYRSHSALAKYWKGNHPTQIFNEITHQVLELIGSGALPHPFEITEAAIQYKPNPDYHIRYVGGSGENQWTSEVDWMHIVIDRGGNVIKVECEDLELTSYDGDDKLDEFLFHGYRKYFKIYKTADWDDA